MEDEDEFIEDQDALLEEDAAVMAGAYHSNDDDEDVSDLSDLSDLDEGSDMDVEDFDQRTRPDGVRVALSTLGMHDDFDMSAFDVAAAGQAHTSTPNEKTEKKGERKAERKRGATGRGRLEIEYEDEVAPRERAKERVRR